jgi:hypothetical protein
MLRYLRSLVSAIKAGTKGLLNLLPPFWKKPIRGKKEDWKYQMSKLYRQSHSTFQSVDTVLFWVPGGMPLMLHVEGAIAAALRLRGTKVQAVICDGPFRACMKREISDNIPFEHWRDACPNCKAQTSAVLDCMGIPYSFIGDFVSESSRSELWEMTASITKETLDSLCYEGINVGKNALSSILRYLKGNDLVGHEVIVREYAFSALVIAAAAGRSMKTISPSHFFTSHGVYVDWGPALQIALSRKIPVTTWMASYLPWHFYFRHIEDGTRPDCHNLSQVAWEECQLTVLSAQQNIRLDDFLGNRYKNSGSFDMKNLVNYSGEINRLKGKYAPISSKPVWGIFPHINWDCVFDLSPMAYPTFDKWILDTINEIIEIPEVQWLIKIHPAEAWENPESGVQRLIEKHFSTLPHHVRVIPAKEEINPLEFFELIDGGVNVYGTSGLELALLGKPVILAGEAHYGNKGFTHDGLTPGAYKQLLRKAGSLKPLSEEQRELARRYGHCYFIQRQVPLQVVESRDSIWWKFQYQRRRLLLPGEDPFLDFICERIFDGKDFVMDERLVELSETLI